MVPIAVTGTATEKPGGNGTPVRPWAGGGAGVHKAGAGMPEVFVRVGGAAASWWCTASAFTCCERAPSIRSSAPAAPPEAGRAGYRGLRRGAAGSSSAGLRGKCRRGNSRGPRGTVPPRPERSGVGTSGTAARRPCTTREFTTRLGLTLHQMVPPLMRVIQTPACTDFGSFKTGLILGTEQ